MHLHPRKAFIGTTFYLLDFDIQHKMTPMTATPEILIVDDDPIFLEIVSSMVQYLGYPVITAADGLEALELFREHTESIVLVLLDINMPKLDGISTFRYIRNMSKNVKIIMVSGAFNERMRTQISPLCPLACLDKPISFERLSNVLSLG